LAYLELAMLDKYVVNSMDQNSTLNSYVMNYEWLIKNGSESS